MAVTGLRLEETIVALASAPGKGAIAVVRISGPRAFDIARKHVRPWPATTRVSTHCQIFDEEGTLDDAVVTTFASPSSFTGEDVVELSTHGGYAVPGSVVAALVRSGAVAALPGEFTRRALINGKLDLLQAEGIGELINATSSAMQRAALSLLQGELSRKLSALREQIVRLEALIAYDIDFPGEDDGPVSEGEVDAAVREIDRALVELLSTASFGRVIRDGASVVIAGPPNAGKSSLFNAMLGTARAIVTEIPGTTRDALEAVIDTGEWPLRLVDTAGLRPTDDRIEKLGIEASERCLAAADIVLACGESLGELERLGAVLSPLTDAPVIRVWTKGDLREPKNPESDQAILSVSAGERTGLQELFVRISEILSETYGHQPREEPVITTARQHTALTLSLDELRRFAAARSTGAVPTTIAAVHLREATTALEELIGAVDVEDVLTKLFSTFCVGK